jgi:hypothetical protein
MKAIIRTGKHKGCKVEVVQWCNDWFSVNLNGEPKIVKPSALYFSLDLKTAIMEHDNNGVLFQLYEFKPIYFKEIYWTFVRKKNVRR